MEKIAILNLNSDSIKMQFLNVNKNKSYSAYKSVSMPINLTKDFYNDNFIKPAVIKDIMSIVLVYKKMIDKEEIKTTLCFASPLLKEAKNNNGVLNEIMNATGFEFKVVNEEDEISYIYSAIINSFNKPKGLIVNIGNFTTSLIMYNRRNIIETKSFDFGYETLYNKYFNIEKQSDIFVNDVKKEFSSMLKELEMVTALPEEFEIIGVGNMFLNLGALARKASKYSLNLQHNYPVNKEDFNKVFSLLKGQDLSKPTKVKEVSIEDSKYLLSAFAMISALFDECPKDVITISRTGFNDGVALNFALPLTLEKPISDTLGFSLQTINEYYDNNSLSALQVYNISMILFKQLKVLHKLGRPYIRVLRIASYLYNSGLRVGLNNKERNAFDIILNSDIYGVSHAEILMASFVVKLCEADNFNLSEWVRYKDILNENDMQAVKKLSVILKIAENLNITEFGNVIDINCDILGDSVIMKTIISEGQDASLEIKCASLVANEFKKSFNKNLEII